MANDIFDQLREIIRQGDDQKVRNFLVQNVKEFPVDVQDEIILGFLEEAATAQGRQAAAVKTIRDRGIAMIDELEKTKEKLEDKRKLLDIKENF